MSSRNRIPQIPLRDNQKEDVIWKRWLQVFIQAYDSISHNGLTGLQGGSTGEYYHLTASELSAVLSGSNLKIIYSDESLTIPTNIQVTGHQSLTFTGTGNLSIEGTGSLRII